jgi:glycerol-3-phosphate dehydrogenase
VVKTVEDADLLLFVIPHQFILRTCKSLVGKIKPTATALSLVKGLNNPEPGKIGLISDVIKETLGIEVGVLMGANVANEVASGEYCETTIGNSRRYTARYAVVPYRLVIFSFQKSRKRTHLPERYSNRQLPSGRH